MEQVLIVKLLASGVTSSNISITEALWLLKGSYQRMSLSVLPDFFKKKTITELSRKHSLLKYVLLDLHVAQKKLHSPHLAPHPRDNINYGLDSALIK